jgi:RNA polymerase sigma factor (sigma-70 family)
LKKRRGRKRKLQTPKLLELMDRSRKCKVAQSRLFDSPDDAAQEYGLRMLEGKSQRATVGQALVDMIRERVGRTTAPGFLARMNLGHALYINDETFDRGTDPYEAIDQRLVLEKLVLRLKEREQHIMLMYLEGYTLSEIAREFKVTQAYIHQLWHDATLLMRKWARA